MIKSFEEDLSSAPSNQIGPLTIAYSFNFRESNFLFWPPCVLNTHGTHTEKQIHTHTYIHTYIHTLIYTHTHINTHTHIHTYIHTLIYTHTHINTHTYIHTYIHTLIFFPFLLGI